MAIWKQTELGGLDRVGNARKALVCNHAWIGGVNAGRMELVARSPLSDNMDRRNA